MILSIAGWSLCALVEGQLLDEFDRAMLTRAHRFADAVEQDGEHLDLEFADPNTADFVAGERGEHLLLSTASGVELYRSPALAGVELALPAAGAEGWSELPTGERVRTLALEFDASQAEGSAATRPARLRLVLLRESPELERAETALRGRLVLVGAATLAAAALVLVWVVRRGVRPVERAAERIAAIREDDLTIRLDAESVPLELAPIVDRVNGLIERLDAAFARERAFSDDAAHELRTPLAALSTTLQVAAARPRSESEYMEALAASATIVEQLQGTVERLLELARLDAGRSATRSAPYDFVELLLTTWDPFTARAHARRLHVEWELPDRLVTDLDRELVVLVLRNLLDNAVSHADTGGRVRVGLVGGGTRAVLFAVTNSGSRLDADAARNARRRFWRGAPERAEAGVHCGLGLTIVERATQALGGALALDSERGGEFRVTVSFPNDSAPRIAS